MDALILPTIHRNGTSAQELYDRNRDAADAIRKAIDKLWACGPNGRDYYVQGADAISQAVKQHETRIDRLQSVYAELETIAQEIVDEGGL